MLSPPQNQVSFCPIFADVWHVRVQRAIVDRAGDSTIGIVTHAISALRFDSCCFAQWLPCLMISGQVLTSKSAHGLVTIRKFAVG